MNTNTQHFDVLIVGGGLVGSAQAIALANQGLRIGLIERMPFEAVAEPGKDGRASAIALASRRVLTHIDVWADIAPHAEPIFDIRVVDEHSHSFVHFHYEDAQLADAPGEPFGHIVDNDFIRAALVKHVSTHANITLFAPSELTDVTQDEAAISVSLADGERLQAPLLLACDGKFSKLRDMVGITHKWVDYNQTAIVCVLNHTEAHQGLALERFLPQGPFAILPMIDKGTHHRSAIVWAETPERVEQLMALNGAEFTQALSAHAGEYLGDITLAGKRHSWPLKLMLSSSYTAPRIAFVGDSAHAIHPIAGQGVNLGYRDVAFLTDLIVERAKLGLDIGGDEMLNAYKRSRRGDAVSMSAMTDGIDRLFSNDIIPVRGARRLGLRAVEKIAPLKRFFMQRAMGLGNSDLPPLLQPVEPNDKDAA